MSNVTMWLALDENNEYITIKKSEKGKDYYCPECGSIVRARAKDSEFVTEHFYHLNKNNCSCESAIHKYWKDNLIHIGDEIDIPTIGRVTCIDKRVEFRFNTSKGVYQPDLIIKTNDKDNQFIIFEIYNTNKKNINQYIDIWEELNHSVCEIDVKGLSFDYVVNKNDLNILYSKHKEVFLHKVKLWIHSTNNELKRNIRDSLRDELDINTIPSDIRDLMELGFVNINDLENKFLFCVVERNGNKKYLSEEGLEFKEIQNELDELKNIIDKPIKKKYVDKKLKYIKNKKWSKNNYFQYIKHILEIYNQLVPYVN